jgi:pimeloyl-ACP methyl ester carboxylesterase
MQLEQSILEVDNEKIVCEVFLRKDNAIILHGAGVSDRKRYYVLAKAILRRGIGVILFDFSGHGDSTGELKDLSLNRRRIQAQSVIDNFVPYESQLYLIGFSMSGQTVCDLLPIYKERIPAILLGCPGIYTKLAQEIIFGGGEFTTKIRSVDSWKDSSALDELCAFEGKTVIAVGDEDQVIPNEIVASLKESSKYLSYVEYPGVDHQLAIWLAAHESEQDKLLDLLLDSKYDIKPE